MAERKLAVRQKPKKAMKALQYGGKLRGSWAARRSAAQLRAALAFVLRMIEACRRSFPKACLRSGSATA